MPSSAADQIPDSVPPQSGIRSVLPGRIVRPLDGAPQPPKRGRRVNTNRSWPPSPSVTADYPRVEPPEPMPESAVVVIAPLAPVPSPGATPVPVASGSAQATSSAQSNEAEVEIRASGPDLSELADRAGDASRRRKIAYIALGVIALLGLAELIALSAG